jgi:putative addiction module component (TIGR02574 family)
MIAADIDITNVLRSALSMPRPERSYLAERLLISLDLEDDDEMPQQWRAEMDARVQSRERGETRSISHEEVMADLDAVIA